MSLQIQQIADLESFKKWRAAQKADLLHRWGQSSEDYAYGVAQLDALQPQKVGWPCVLVFFWISVDRGPFLVFTVVTLDQFPKFRLLQLQLEQAEAELLRVREITDRLSKGNKS